MRSRVIWSVALAILLNLNACTSTPSDEPDKGKAGGSPTPDVAVSSQPLSYGSLIEPDGVGPVKIGMTLREASQASGANFRVEGFNSEEGATCYWARPDGLEGLQLQMETDTQPTDPFDGPIAVIHIRDSRFRTSKDIRVGSTEQEVRNAYPSARVEPYEYDPGGHVLSVEGNLHFVTNGSKVASVQVGSYRSEGCS